MMENGLSKPTLRPLTWLLRKLAHGLPPVPTIGGRALATRVAGLLLVGGAALIAVTVALPPAAAGSDLLILVSGGVAPAAGPRDPPSSSSAPEPWPRAAARCC